MVDIVDEEVELRLVDTRKLVEEAKKIKELQKLKDKADNALKKSPAKLRQEKEELKKLKESSKKPLVSSTSPVPFIGKEETLPKKESQAQTRLGAIKGQNTNNEFKKMQKKIKELEKKQKEIVKNEKNLRSELFDKLSMGKNLLTDASVTGIATGVLSRLGPIGIAVGTVLAILLPGALTQFERGGIFSTKLPITQQEKTINEIDFVVDVNSGTKFLTSDMRIAQKAPDTSNTQNLRFEHIRFVAQENGK